ncbi:MAG: hypothetical protein ACRCUM_02760 [Mycoplasmoidaceae bacterium]
MEDIKNEEVVEETSQEEPQVETPQEEASGAITEERVRKICEEMIGAFLDKFVPPSPQDPQEEPQEEQEQEDDGAY